MELANAMRIQDGMRPIDERTVPTLAPVRRGSALGVTMLRPSSAKRLANLHTLVAEFARRDIGRAGVAALLECSLSASRNYLAELLDARVVFSCPAKPGIECGDRTLYRLTPDPIAVRDFLTALVTSFGASPASGSAADHVQRVGRDLNSELTASIEPARRDPLVAALFGAAGHS